MKNEKEEFESIVGDHRVEFLYEKNGWVVYRTTVSNMTMEKFVQRARKHGFKVFLRDGKIGFLKEEKE